ncbi:endonuclease domain-containing protein [Pontibacter fetidus]|uniref:Endonuclease domain-containing protein n=1 Tax=Pontibacter fetidus TaxID=2700082 RepID=A0A6B2H2X9_9BACT|nr:endonuclease domain-containing protein [Pontibacter fetidus]NDK57465.1 endonuclease domain-containing protein [Pontibacter fetidus]
MTNLLFRRQLRRDSTSAEVILWQALRNRQVKGRKFRRQHTIGKYIVDFFCFEEKLIIELDGQSHQNLGTEYADILRDEWLRQQGFRVLRFENSEVYTQLQRVVWAIENEFGNSGSITF